jgi:DNA primase
VNGEQGVYYCFGCRASGDAIKFVRETQHLEFREALQFLADRAGIELHDDAESGPRRKERAELLETMANAVSWYHERLLNSPDARPAREYLRSRGIDGELARRFSLGWAPDEWDGLTNGLNLTTKALSGTGLGFENSRGRRQDALRARIIFPIFDVSGKPIAVGGRILPKEVNDAPPQYQRPEPKYKNSPETSIYAKRRTLYALNLAKDDIIRSGEIIVCEGYTDVIAFFKAEMPRAVATCGTALSEEHFQTLRNFAKRIVLAYDADSAGQSAAASVYQWEKKHEVDVFVARLPQGMDPAELAQRDPAALRGAIDNAMPFLQFRIERVLSAGNLNSPEGRSRTAEAAAAVIAEHPAPLVRDEYLRQVADRCRVDVELLRPTVERARRGGAREAPSASAVQPRVVTPSSRPGRAALALLVHEPESVEGRFVAEYFVDPIQRAAFEALAGGSLVSDAVDELERRDDIVAAQLVREISVDEVSAQLTEDGAIAALAAQLLRAATADALQDVDRELRAGAVTPESALTVIRDVKLRLAELDGPRGEDVERELRDWLVSRAETHAD